MIGTIGVGIVGVGIFVIVKLGLIKSWFILKTLPGLLSARMIYAAFPFGLSFLLLTIFPFLPSYDPRHPSLAFFAVLLGGPVFGFWFMYRPPKWIVPKWLRWLEREYGYCVDILLEDAQRMGRWDWEWQVRSQAGMQTWIDSVMEREKQRIEWRWLYEKVRMISDQNRKAGIFVNRAPGIITEPVPEHRQNEKDLRVTQEDLDEFRQLKKEYGGLPL
jgi:hypothetical protein